MIQIWALFWFDFGLTFRVWLMMRFRRWGNKLAVLGRFGVWIWFWVVKRLGRFVVIGSMLLMWFWATGSMFLIAVVPFVVLFAGFVLMRAAVWFVFMRAAVWLCWCLCVFSLCACVFLPCGSAVFRIVTVLDYVLYCDCFLILLCCVICCMFLFGFATPFGCFAGLIL